MAGPCGGSNAYKAAGAPDVPVGSKVSLSLQYAAGHESAQNVFTATFRCGAPTENQMTAGTAGTTTLTAAQCTTTQGGTAYPVPAPTGRDAKVVECTLPTKTAAELAGTGGQCTMSFQDQRDWGGCMDINYVAAAAAPGPGDGQGGGGGGGQPPAAPTAPVPPATAVKSTSLTNIVTSGPPPALECCGLTTHDVTATPGPKTSAGETTLLLSGSVSGNQCVAGLNYPQNTISLTLNNVQLNGKVGALSFTKTVGAQVLLGGIPMDIDYISNVLTFTMNGEPTQNNPTGNPRVCDTEFIMGAGPPAAGSPPNTQVRDTPDVYSTRTPSTCTWHHARHHSICSQHPPICSTPSNITIQYTHTLQYTHLPSMYLCSPSESTDGQQPQHERWRERRCERASPVGQWW